MKTNCFYKPVFLLGILACSTGAFAQFNSESVTFFEKPLSFEVGSGVVELNNRVSLSYQSSNNGGSSFDAQEVNTEMEFYSQLENDWDVSLEYFGSYHSERNDNYEDILRLGVADQWGEIKFGDISNIVFERTNRQTPVGLLAADNDQFTLPLDSLGAFYQWSTPSTQWMVALDKDSNIELGVSYYKPINGVEYLVSARANSVNNNQGDAQGVSEANGYALVGQIQRGRWVIDTQLLREDVALLSNSEKISLNALSLGINYNANRWQASLSGVQRDNELNDTERQFSVGARYFFARGLSMEAGSNVISTEQFKNEIRAHAISLNYEF